MFQVLKVRINIEPNLEGIFFFIKLVKKLLNSPSESYLYNKFKVRPGRKTLI